MGRVEAALQTLELDRTASREEIKQAYKDLVVVWHPDRFPHNPRLRQKAEEKLKRFNQAYEHLKGWQPVQPTSASAWSACASVSTRHPPAASSRCCSRRSSRSHGRSRRSTRSTYAPRSGSSNTLISLADAALILQRYHFDPVDPAQCRYHGGPFVLVVCEAPPEVMISVPCDSLQRFDRILLSIPCKSMGHFIQQDAEQLLQLLHAQDDTEPG